MKRTQKSAKKSTARPGARAAKADGESAVLGRWPKIALLGCGWLRSEKVGYLTAKRFEMRESLDDLDIKAGIVDRVDGRLSV